MKHSEFFRRHQARVAKISISVSAFRNQGRPGLIEAGRNFCADKVNLNQFASALRRGSYSKYLQHETNKMCAAINRHGGKWGTARKGLNIFFRDIFYTQFFYSCLRLNDAMKAQLEIPLDSKTGIGLKRKIKERGLADKILVPPWKTIMSVDEVASDQFQAAAKEFAKRLDPRFDAVDLDIWLWVDEG